MMCYSTSLAPLLYFPCIEILKLIYYDYQKPEIVTFFNVTQLEVELIQLMNYMVHYSCFTEMQPLAFDTFFEMLFKQ